MEEGITVLIYSYFILFSRDFKVGYIKRKVYVFISPSVACNMSSVLGGETYVAFLYAEDSRENTY
jgi:hypothetical protein